MKASLIENGTTICLTQGENEITFAAVDYRKIIEKISVLAGCEKTHKLSAWMCANDENAGMLLTGWCHNDFNRIEAFLEDPTGRKSHEIGEFGLGPDDEVSAEDVAEYFGLMEIKSTADLKECLDLMLAGEKIKSPVSYNPNNPFG